MALRTALRTGADLGVNNARTFITTAFLRRLVPPLGPMPNEDLDSTDLESLEKYRSYTRYLRKAEEARNKPAWWKTYRSYVEKQDPEHDAEKVDIGLPYLRPSRLKEVKERTQMVKENKRNAELERASRLRTLKVSLDRVQDEWGKSSGPFHIQRLAEHYGVFRDLFPNALFLPQVLMQIDYSQDHGGQVHYGNRLTPTEAASVPQISFEAEAGSLWTLMLTCPGTGFHRYVYFLFKQEVRIDFQEDVRTSPCLSLAERSFKTLDFYRKHQDAMTPAGLSFFQSQWDESVSDTFHNSLNMREPVFEFIRPPVYHPPQVKHPHRQPLRYLDRYRNGKEHTYGIY
ncbi:hypothetical protein KUCAC02_035139 [Chaenocephalus aceratus]|nr:hypothetical protein KUCAC02_035139 [Chaenocephalus aceratus]